MGSRRSSRPLSSSGAISSTMVRPLLFGPRESAGRSRGQARHDDTTAGIIGGARPLHAPPGHPNFGGIDGDRGHLRIPCARPLEAAGDGRARRRAEMAGSDRHRHVAAQRRTVPAGLLRLGAAPAVPVGAPPDGLGNGRAALRRAGARGARGRSAGVVVAGQRRADLGAREQDGHDHLDGVVDGQAPGKPIAARVGLPRSPNSSTSRLLAPLITRGWSAKPGAEFT